MRRAVEEKVRASPKYTANMPSKIYDTFDRHEKEERKS